MFANTYYFVAPEKLQPWNCYIYHEYTLQKSMMHWTYSWTLSLAEKIVSVIIWEKTQKASVTWVKNKTSFLDGMNTTFSLL